MTPKEAELKYGKKNFKKMQRFLKGITVVIDSDENIIEIPERDLERAFEMAIMGYSNIPCD